MASEGGEVVSTPVLRDIEAPILSHYFEAE